MSDRLFVAVWPTAEVGAVLAALARPEIPGVRWTTADQWHVTLRFLGEVDADVAAAAFAAAVLPDRPAKARLGPESRRFDRTLTVDVDGLAPLARGIIDATESIGRRPERREFSGHVTLARVRRHWPAAAANLRYEVAAAWPVREVALVRSTLDPGGARYENVAVRTL